MLSCLIGVGIDELTVAGDRHHLILPRIIVDLDHVACSKVVNQEFTLGDVFLTRHIVLIRLELRTLIAYYVHDPEIADLTLVSTHERELLRVLGPCHISSLAVVLVLFRGHVGLTTTSRAAVGVELFTVCCQLDLFNLDIFFGLSGFITTLTATCIEDRLVIGSVDHPEVVVTCEHNGLTVR